MKFSINSVILWPKNNEFPYRILPFSENAINVITGASRTGKSAIIPIIDYCLCSQKCNIPVDVIRDTCAWFGVLFNLDSNQLLLCRREPGNQVSTNEMYMKRDVTIEIPDRIEGNTNVESVKNTLNELFSMSFLDLDPSNRSFSFRPSFRDFMAFLFQPQNIVANADVLFYKADTTEHRQKLINVFPYALGALTPEALAARQELDRLRKYKERITRDIDAIKDVSESWRQEVSGWLSYARELGLTTYEPSDDSTFEEQVDQLEVIVRKTANDSSIQSIRIKDFSDELTVLRSEEQQISSHLFALQKRHNEMKLLKQSMSQYENALQIQIERLEISKWLKTIIDPQKLLPLSQTGYESPLEMLDTLCHSIEEIEQSASGIRAIPAAFEREFERVETEIAKETDKLRAIKKRITEENSMYINRADKKYTLTEVARFLGKLEASIQTYKRLGRDEELENMLDEVNSRIDILEKKVNEKEIRKKQDSALRFICQKIGDIIPLLDTDHPNDPVEFVVKDLSVKIKNVNGRDDYLWDIGSASNWLAYHVAVILAFQAFFQIRNVVSVPNFIVFDQPSQVYFPQISSRKDINTDEQRIVSDEDKIAVRKVFKAMSAFKQATDLDIQIIVTEHADEDVWGDIDGIHLVEKWRGGNQKLVPNEWVVNQ